MHLDRLPDHGLVALAAQALNQLHQPRHALLAYAGGQPAREGRGRGLPRRGE